MFDILSFCRYYRIAATQNNKSVSSGWVGLHCPFCRETDGFHLGFNLSSGHFSCWKCGFHRTDETIQRLVHVSVQEVRKILKQYEVDKLPTSVKDKSAISNAEYVHLPENELTVRDRRYLESRGFDPDELIRRYDLRSGGFAGYWKYRIIIPIHDGTGRIVSATARGILAEMEPRYKTLPDRDSVIPAKHTLFGVHLLPTDADRVIVVEGPIDQFRMGPGTVATYGTGVTDMQIQQLVAFDRVTVMFDGNEAGRIGAEKLATSLAVLGVPHVEVFDLPNDVEPDTWDVIERLTFLEDFWRVA